MVFGEDIIIEILSRLPVKSLLKLKCVCKEWLQLIESDVFINEHFNRETNHPHLLVQYIPPFDVLGLPLPNGFNDKRERCRFAFFPDKDLKGTLAHEDLYKRADIGYIFGPVSGLFFLYSQDVRVPYGQDKDNPMFLWNPATRQLKRIVYPPKPRCSNLIHNFGFGFDRSSKDYKVICFRSYFSGMSGYPGYPTDVTIYRLSKDSWSSPVELYFSPSNSLGNTFINGAYYWISSLMGVPKCSLISFDMASEKFRDIKGPDNLHYLSDDLWFQKVLMLYNDHLAIVVSKRLEFEFNQTQYYMWIMEEEGCWIKLLTIGPFQDWGVVKGVWKKNKLLIKKPVGPRWPESVGRLLLYDVDSSETNDLDLRSSSGSFYPFSYKESLVSVNICNSSNRQIKFQ